MSYAQMDHAEWVESNNRAGKTYTRKPKRDAHGNVIGFAQAPEKLSAFQARVMDIVGITYGGIYNAPITWETFDWNCCGGISFVVGQSSGWATFDFNRLTMLVFLCHEARVRADISNAGPRHFRLGFWQRSHEGGMARRHPNLDEARIFVDLAMGAHPRASPGPAP